MTRNWRVQSLVALSMAVACATATKEDLAGGGGDEKGGAGGSSGTGTGGSSGFGGTFPTGGSFPKGGTPGTGGVSTGGSAGKGGTAGKGGATTGGSDMGGMGDGGEGPDACSVRGTPPDLRIDYKAGTKTVTEDPDGVFKLVNETSAAIPLSELTFRYWFTSEFTCDQTTSRWRTNVTYFNLQNPYSGKQPGDTTTKVVSLDTGAPGCDAYFEVGFTAGSGSLAAGQTAEIGYFAQIDLYDKPHNQSNDYSYGACATMFVYWDKITVYRNGRLVTGTPPGGGGGEGGAGGEGGMSGGGGGI